jgi:hypothetical protein
MTRKSKREIENAIDELTGEAVAPSDGSFDAREGVTAPFVTYEDTAPGETLPEGVDVARVVDDDGPGATFVVAETDADGDNA